MSDPVQNNDAPQNEDGEKSQGRTLGRASTFLIILVIAGIAGALILWTYSSEPEAQREGATKQTAMLVEVEKVRRGNFTPRIEGLGMVEAAQDIMLSPRIDGRVIEIADTFIPGGFVSKDEALLTIDPSDYQNTVKQRESELRQARSDLDIELGRRDVAQKEYDLLDRTLSAENKTLVLREPQLAAARASVLSAQAALDQAKLELARTKIEAPFDAQILSRNVNVGSQVDPGMTLARLVGVDEYWVMVSVPVAKLDRIAFPEDGQAGAPVIIRNRAAWPADSHREGRVKRLIGVLDDQTRLARVLVSVKDPLALEDDAKGPRMIVGGIVQAEIEGSPLENVFRIDRNYLRENDTLWIKRDGKLAITEATVLFKDKDHAYIAEGLKDGDLLVTSNLSTVAEGVPLRTEQENTPTQDNEEESPE